MTPAEREQLIKAKAEKLARKKIKDIINITHPDGEVTAVIITENEALPEEPAIKPRRHKTK